MRFWAFLWKTRCLSKRSTPLSSAAALQTPNDQYASRKAFRDAHQFLLAHRADHAAARAGFSWPQLPQFNFALDWFDAELAQGARRQQLALSICGEHAATLTFEQLSERSNRVANGLLHLGIQPGDRVLVMLGNVTALWETMLAVMKIGAVASPTTPLLTPAELSERIFRGNIRHVIAASEDTPKFKQLAPRITRIAVGEQVPGWHGYGDLLSASPELAARTPTKGTDPMLLYFTSGTTAKAKMVLHSHSSYPVGHLTTAYWLGLLPGDRHLNISSPGWAKHAYSRQVALCDTLTNPSFFAPWIAGATVCIVNLPGRFQARPLLDAIVEQKVTTLCAPPTVWRLLVQEDLTQWRTHLRELCSAGEPLNSEVISQVHTAWGIHPRDGYGQTETTLQVGVPPGLCVRAGAMGLPMPGYDVRLLDSTGYLGQVVDAVRPTKHAAETNKGPLETWQSHQCSDAVVEGELVMVLDPRPVGLMLGYQAESGSVLDVATSVALPPLQHNALPAIPVPETVTALTQPAQCAVYRTGDLAMRDSEGWLVYVGRMDDVFKSSDYRISPFELESILVEHPAVAEAAVVPVPCPTRLATPKAFITLAPGWAADRATALALFLHVRAKIAPFRRIRRITFGELPKTISGKIRRVALRAAEQQRHHNRHSDTGSAGRDDETEFREEDFPEL